VQAPVDGLDQTDPPGQQMHPSDPAAGQSPGAIGDVVPDVAGPEHRGRLIIPLPFTETILDSPLASNELSSYAVLHSKCLLAYKRLWVDTFSYTHGTRHFEHFFNNPADNGKKLRLFRA